MLIARTSRFQVWRFFAHNRLRNYTYVLQETATQEALVIDPWDGEQILTWARGEKLKLIGVLNTHGHADHTQGNAVLIQNQVPVLNEQVWLEKKSAPGHTMDHVLFILNDGQEQHVFAGDTIFQAGVGNCKNGGEPTQLFQTIERLLIQLPDHALLHCGHDYWERNLAFAQHVMPSNQFVLKQQALCAQQVTYEMSPSTWGEEKKINPFLNTSATQLRERVKELSSPLAVNIDSDQMCFVSLRRLRDQW
jgi:hydroxyacylglutathione hydrolase